MAEYEELTEEQLAELIDMQDHLDWLRWQDRLNEIGVWI